MGGSHGRNDQTAPLGKPRRCCEPNPLNYPGRLQTMQHSLTTGRRAPQQTRHSGRQPAAPSRHGSAAEPNPAGRGGLQGEPEKSQPIGGSAPPGSTAEEPRRRHGAIPMLPAGSEQGLAQPQQRGEFLALQRQRVADHSAGVPQRHDLAAQSPVLAELALDSVRTHRAGTAKPRQHLGRDVRLGHPDPTAQFTHTDLHHPGRLWRTGGEDDERQAHRVADPRRRQQLHRSRQTSPGIPAKGERRPRSSRRGRARLLRNRT